MKKKLEEFYIVKKYDKDSFLIFDKNKPGRRMLQKFLCLLYKNDLGYFVKDKQPTKKIDVIIKQIEDYVNCLPFDSEHYYPTYGINAVLEFCVMDYLQSIGMVYNEYAEDLTYSLPKNLYDYEDSCSLSIRNLDVCYKHEDVYVCFYSKNDVFDVKQIKCERNIESLMNAINSLIKPLYLERAIKFSKLYDLIALNVLNGITHVHMYVKTNEMIFDKFDLKTKLQDLIDKL